MSLPGDPSKVTEAHLRALIADRIPEGRAIDYKQALYSGKDQDKVECLADLVSFANAAGGHLVFGMVEDNLLPVDLPGLADVDWDREIGRLMGWATSGIEPRIPGLAAHAVPLANGTRALVVAIPASDAGPHRIAFNHLHRLYGRNSHGKYILDHHEVRALFARETPSPGVPLAMNSADAPHAVHRPTDQTEEGDRGLGRLADGESAGPAGIALHGGGDADFRRQFQEDRLARFHRQHDAFDQLLRRALPGRNAREIVTGPGEVARLIAALADGREACELWWVRDRLASPARAFAPLGDGRSWLIAEFECAIVAALVCNLPTPGRPFVLLQLAPQPPFPGIAHAAFAGRASAGLHAGRYIPIGEFEDGYAIVDGRSVELTGATRRTRNLATEFLLLAPQLSVYVNYEDPSEQEEIFGELRAAGTFSAPLIERLARLARPGWMSEWD